MKLQNFLATLPRCYRIISEMEKDQSFRSSPKILILAAAICLTLAIHYGMFGHHAEHSHFLRVIHGRLCYVPIVIAAVWFGLAGGLLCAFVISVAVTPYIVRIAAPRGELSQELTEIVFYFAIGMLSGALVEREKRQRIKMEEAQEKLAQNQRLSMMGQMAAGVAHEIKNPLASIRGAADILAGDLPPDSPKQEFAEIIRREVRRLDTTVRSFLDFARPQPCRFSMQRLGEILTSTIKQMEPQILAASLTLESKIPDFDELVCGDPEKLRQVFINLILNAVSATPAGGKIVIELGKTTRNRQLFWEIRFTDTGSGIARADIERIFEPFYTQKATGSGLGLAIVKSIVSEHGGTLEVASEPGQGSTFTIFLPITG